MNEPAIHQVGEGPKYDKDLGTTSSKLTRGIRKKVLLREYDAEPGQDTAMLEAYKSSDLGVDEFLDNWKQ